jgi:hypothetical protein
MGPSVTLMSRTRPQVSMTKCCHDTLPPDDRAMTSGQKAGVVLTVVAIALWLVVVIAVLATPPDEGANIGAGLLGLPVLTLSISAAVVLITTADSTAPRAASAVSIALWALFMALSWSYAAENGVQMSIGLAATVALSTSAVLVGTAHRRPRR